MNFFYIILISVALYFVVLFIAIYREEMHKTEEAKEYTEMNTPNPCDQCLHCVCKLEGIDGDDCELGLPMGNEDCEGFTFFEDEGIGSDVDYYETHAGGKDLREEYPNECDEQDWNLGENEN